MTPRSIWFHATSPMTWDPQRPPDGITRVEQEYCRWALQYAPRIRFCFYDKTLQRFYEISAKELAAKVGVKDAAISADRRDGFLYRLLSLLRLGLFRLGLFRKGDAFISLGADWYHLEGLSLPDLKAKYDLRIICMSYDIIPILFPHHAAESPKQFERHFLEMTSTVDHLLCISENTRRDVEAELIKRDLQPPVSSVVRLGSEIKITTTGHAPAGFDHAPDARPFVLFVSTIESRKNHELLYRAWKRIREMGQTSHRLVFVGSIGWGVSDLVKVIAEDEHVRDDIVLLHHINDDGLSWLYKNAAFTVYPSLYEGWGLPLAESLAYGKFCLASNAASLPEAGGPWAEYLDPRDLPAWVERLSFYMKHPEQVEARNAKIAREFSPPTWSDMGEAIHRVALGRRDS